MIKEKSYQIEIEWILVATTAISNSSGLWLKRKVRDLFAKFVIERKTEWLICPLLRIARTLYANWLRILHLAKNQHFNFNQMKKEKSTDE